MLRSDAESRLVIREPRKMIVVEMATNTTSSRGSLFYEYKLGTTAAVAARKIRTAFGNDAVSDRTTQKSSKKLSSGAFSLTNEARSAENVEANSSTTCLELAEAFNMSD
ncbi:hypothetical protein Trydic_g544 [Trypoxylus dichotomus]